jgi:L-2-hydroxyglutarate oxidase LhgO
MGMKTDFLIIGAGIIGLAAARELKIRHPDSKVVILEKEDMPGRHASGRNSGVLHSGIFYAEDSIKAKVCSQGGRALQDYCLTHHLSIQKVGKVILPIEENTDSILRNLYERGKKNGIPVNLIDEKELKKIEPEACTRTGEALHLPEVCIVEGVEVVNQIAGELIQKGVEIYYNQPFVSADLKKKQVKSKGDQISYGYLLNAAGVYADKVAHSFRVGRFYAILPFKGLYYSVLPSSGLKVNGLIYALPNLKFPFLGIHFTKRLNGEIAAGPTIIPAFGRESYGGLQGINLFEIPSIARHLLSLYAADHQNFRAFVWKEGLRFIKTRFYESASVLVPALKIEHLAKSSKVGIRAQLVNLQTLQLVTDFLIEKGENSTHILNAVSPAFTSAFAFSKLVLDQAGI